MPPPRSRGRSLSRPVIPLSSLLPLRARLSASWATRPSREFLVDKNDNQIAGVNPFELQTKTPDLVQVDHRKLCEALYLDMKKLPPPSPAATTDGLVATTAGDVAASATTAAPMDGSKESTGEASDTVLSNSHPPPDVNPNIAAFSSSLERFRKIQQLAPKAYLAVVRLHYDDSDVSVYRKEPPPPVILTVLGPSFLPIDGKPVDRHCFPISDTDRWGSTNVLCGAGVWTPACFSMLATPRHKPRLNPFKTVEDSHDSVLFTTRAHRDLFEPLILSCPRPSFDNTEEAAAWQSLVFHSNHPIWQSIDENDRQVCETYCSETPPDAISAWIASRVLPLPAEHNLPIGIVLDPNRISSGNALFDAVVSWCGDSSETKADRVLYENKIAWLKRSYILNAWLQGVFYNLDRFIVDMVSLAQIPDQWKTLTNTSPSVDYVLAERSFRHMEWSLAFHIWVDGLYAAVTNPTLNEFNSFFQQAGNALRNTAAQGMLPLGTCDRNFGPYSPASCHSSSDHWGERYGFDHFQRPDIRPSFLRQFASLKITPDGRDVPVKRRLLTLEENERAKKRAAASGEDSDGEVEDYINPEEVEAAEQCNEAQTAEQNFCRSLVFRHQVRADRRQFGRK